MNFAAAMNNESRKTFTENGGTAYNTTGSAVLDLFGSIGALREADDMRKETLFAEAYKESPILATKCLFYARDVRGGLGERETFRTLLRYAAIHHPEAIKRNILLIPFYGRYDDWYTLIDTPLEDEMWKNMKWVFELDLEYMSRKEPVSLLAKWMKTADATSKKTRELGILTAKKMGLSVYAYKRKVRALRKYINVVEVKMTAKEWDEINYPAVPARAMMNYRKAFGRHDQERFSKYIQDVSTGKEKINSGTLYPYDILERYGFGSWGVGTDEEDPVLEAQWKALPNYVKPGTNAIVIADTSGSMDGRPIRSAVGLAVYFAERNTGAYHNLWMSFSGDSTIQRLEGETLLQKLANIDTENWGNNTNLERAFMNVLEIAIVNHVAPEEMVKSIIVISDMEIDGHVCSGERVYGGRDWLGRTSYRYLGGDSWSFYDAMEKEFGLHGYKIPTVIFWNVNSRHDLFHADKDRKGVILCSGQATSTFKHVVDTIDSTPYELMLEVLNSERYGRILID